LTNAPATIPPSRQEINTGSNRERISPMLNTPMLNTLTVKTDVGDIEVRENELASIINEKLEQMGMSLANLRWCFTAVKWLANIGRRAVAYRKPDGGLWVQGVKLD
jgi:hypothetical protein